MKKIDDIFKNKLDEKGFDYTEGAWSHMESLLEKDTKKAVFWNNRNIGILLLFLGFSVVSYNYFYIKNQKNTIIEKQQINRSENTNTKTLANSKPAIKTSNTSDKTTAIKTNLYTSNFEKTTSLKTAKYKKPISNEHNSGSDFSIIENTTFPIINSEPLIVNTSTIAPIKTIKNTIDSFNFEKTNLPMADLSYLEISNNLKTIDKASLLTNKNYKYWAYFLSPYVQYITFSTPNFTGQEKIRKSQETMKNSIAYGVQVTAKRNNLAFNMGLANKNYNSITNFTREVKQYSYDTSISLVKRDYKPDGKGGFIALVSQNIDSSEVGKNDVVDCPDCKTRINYLSIPVSIQYEIKQNRFVSFVEAGLNTNILMNAQGLYTSVVNGQTQVLNLEQSNELKKVNLDASFALGLKYKLNDNLFTWASFSKGFGVTSITNSYTQKINYNSIKVGLEVRL